MRPPKTSLRLLGTIILAIPAAFGLAADDAPWVINPPDLETVSPARPGEDGGYNLRQTADGGYVVAGCVSTPGRERDLAVFRFKPDLTPDEGFGDGGLWTFGGSGDDLAIDVIEVAGDDARPDGFLVVGVADEGDGDFGQAVHHGKIDVILARLTNDGRLDSAFGMNGFQLYGGSGDDEVIVHLHNYSEPGERLVQTDRGFIIAAMTRSTDGDLADRSSVGRPEGRDVMLFAVDQAGELLPTFGDRGILRIGTSPGGTMGRRSPNDFVWSLAADPRGGFAAAGYHLGVAVDTPDERVRSPGNDSPSGDNTSDDVKRHRMDGWVFRFDKEGRMRSDWADGGFSFIGGSWQEKIYDVLPVADGYLVTGRTASWDLDFSRPRPAESTFDMVLLKLDPSGRLDRSFGENGLRLQGGNGDDQALRIATLEDGGDIVWLGQSTSRPEEPEADLPGDAYRQVIVTRLSPSGEPKVRWSLGGAGEDKPVGMIVDRDGRVVMTGFRNASVLSDDDDVPDSERDLFIMRFSPSP